MRAVRAALELHGTVRRVSEEVEQRIGAPLAMHTGINTGLVVTTPAEDERGGRVGITGDTVNTAARLVSLAQADQVVIGPDTQRRVAGFFDLESLEPVTLKGKAKPLILIRIQIELYNPLPSGQSMNAFVIGFKGCQSVAQLILDGIQAVEDPVVERLFPEFAP